jgi:hypothetical protein
MTGSDSEVSAGRGFKFCGLRGFIMWPEPQ